MSSSDFFNAALDLSCLMALRAVRNRREPRLLVSLCLEMTNGALHSRLSMLLVAKCYRLLHRRWSPPILSQDEMQEPKYGQQRYGHSNQSVQGPADHRATCRLIGRA